ncbi:ead/Ea22-like family protein [Klebsiella variicola]|uniref:ead/Ea22-like family protein n=1 Tax=Klebsiella variicola TaxID=244366 RepID=UPI0021591B68|nr:ead/Ea22-like family protein [Klebsiella variicola]MCR8651854.1 ead/Ea22-like family protein [Klebsiella variicola]
MTDITELAQREKFEAWFVNDVVGADVNFPAFKDGEYTEGEIYDEQLYFMLQAMWMAWKAAGAELVEALEYYKSREERVTSLVRDNSKSWDELYRQVEAKGKRNVELVEALASEKRICATWRKTAEANSEKLEKAQAKADVYDMLRDDYGLRKKGVGLADFVDWQANRIAELESRTVTVENLQESAYRAGLTAGWNLGLDNNNEGFNKCLAAHAAGIKVEAK